jgi:glucose/arabinose dehydrogenase
MRLYASALPGACMLRLTHTGDLLVSLPRSGRIVLLERDTDGDGAPDARRDLLTGLNRPHGLDLHQGWLYVAETNAVGRIRFDADTRSVRGDYDRVVAGLPSGGTHWSRSVRFGPDGWMYVSVGSSCNGCEERDHGAPRCYVFSPMGARARFTPPGFAIPWLSTGARVLSSYTVRTWGATSWETISLRAS